MGQCSVVAVVYHVTENVIKIDLFSWNMASNWKSLRKSLQSHKKNKGSEWANAAENYWMRFFLEFPAFSLF